MRRKSGLTLALAIFVSGAAPGEAAARCQTGVASAPYIGAADMRAIDRAAARLPKAASGQVQRSIGTPVPSAVKRAPVPHAVAKVLPQYKFAGYAAFRVAGRLAIVNPQGILTYLMPLHGTGAPGNCP